LDASGTHNLPHFNAEPSNFQTALPILHQHPRCVIAYSYIDQSEDFSFKFALSRNDSYCQY